MRSDCRFVHDLKTITCKYWLEGECLKDESCEFAHEIIHETKHGNKHKHGKQQSSSKKAASETVKKDFKLDSEEFPALGGAPVQSVVQNGAEKQSKELSPSKTTTTTTKASVNNVEIPSSQISPKQQTAKTSIANIVKQQQQPVKTIASVLLSNVVSNKSQANVGQPTGKTLSNIVKTPAVSIAQPENKSLTLNNANKQTSNNNYTTKGSNQAPSGSENTTAKGKKNKKSQQKELLIETNKSHLKSTSNSRANSCTRKK